MSDVILDLDIWPPTIFELTAAIPKGKKVSFHQATVKIIENQYYWAKKVAGGDWVMAIADRIIITPTERDFWRTECKVHGHPKKFIRYRIKFPGQLIDNLRLVGTEEKCHVRYIVSRLIESFVFMACEAARSKQAERHKMIATYLFD